MTEETDARQNCSPVMEGKPLRLGEPSLRMPIPWPLEDGKTCLVVRGMSDEEYDQTVGLRSSVCKLGRACEIIADLSNAPKGSSSDKRIGTYTHLALLQPDVFRAIAFVELERVCHKSARGQAFGPNTDAEGWAWAIEQKGPNVIYPGMLDSVHELADAVYANPETAAVMRSIPEGMHELSIFFIDEETGERIKIRLDGLATNAEGVPVAIVDVKTTRNGTKWSFTRDAERFGYYFSLALYELGVRAAIAAGLLPGSPDMAIEWYIVAIHKPSPIEAVLCEVPEETKAIFRRRVRERLDEIAECNRDGSWPGLPRRMVLEPSASLMRQEAYAEDETLTSPSEHSSFPITYDVDEPGSDGVTVGAGSYGGDLGGHGGMGGKGGRYVG